MESIGPPISWAAVPDTPEPSDDDADGGAVEDTGHGAVEDTAAGDPVDGDERVAVPAGRTRGDGRSRRRRWPWVLGIAAVVIVAWGVLAALQLWSAYEHAQDGLATMSGVRTSGTQDLATLIKSLDRSGPDAAAAEDLPDRLASAADSFSAANDAVSSFVFAPLRVLPVVGRQVDSLDALTSAAATTASRAHTAFSDLSGIADDPGTTPEERLAAVGRTQRVLAQLQRGLQGLDLGPTEGLAGPLADARNKFADEYASTTDTLDKAVAATTGVDKFLTGPSQYLVLVANNAEMRAGSGMFLQMGVLTVENGHFQLGELISVEGQRLDHPGAALDPDIERLWGWLVPNEEWRNVNLSPRFDESARMATEMWASSGRGTVDGVIAIDVVGLQRLLELTGPVQVAGADGTPHELDADNVRQRLLLDQYLNFDGQNAARREELGRTGTAVFNAFNQRPVKAEALLRALQQGGRGRNILIWSKDPVEQAAWQALGVSGALPPDALLLSLINRSGTKLDQFVTVDASITSTTTGDLRHVSVKVSMTNSPRPKLPTYVQGPYPRTGYKAGEYVGILSLNVPKGAGNATVEGGAMMLNGDDGPTRMMAAGVDLQAGQHGELTFHFDLPTSWDSMQVLASARIPRVTWSAGGEQWKDDSPRTVDLATTG